MSKMPKFSARLEVGFFIDPPSAIHPVSAKRLLRSVSRRVVRNRIVCVYAQQLLAVGTTPDATKVV